MSDLPDYEFEDNGRTVSQKRMDQLKDNADHIAATAAGRSAREQEIHNRLADERNQHPDWSLPSIYRQFRGLRQELPDESTGKSSDSSPTNLKITPV
jgi:hypothetical protein